jgi:hypothetical protein
LGPFELGVRVVQLVDELRRLGLVQDVAVGEQHYNKK